MQVVLHNSVVSVQHPGPRATVFAFPVAVGLEGGEAEDDGLVVEAEDVEGRLRLGEGRPAGVSDAVEVAGEEEEAEVVVLEGERDGHTALGHGGLPQLGDDGHGEAQPVQGDDLLPDAVDGARPGADAAGVRPVNEDVLVCRGRDLFVNYPGGRLLVIHLRERKLSKLVGCSLTAKPLWLGQAPELRSSFLRG